MTNADPTSKKARRDHARETARELREQERKRRVRNRIFLQGGIGLAIIAIVAIIVVVVTTSVQNSNKSAVGPANMASDGILLTGSDGAISAVKTAGIKSGATPTPTDTSAYSGTVNVVTYIDYQCPYCEQFETTNGDTLKQLVQAGSITLEVHPIAFLDSSSLGNKYSTRSANAAACVAQYDPDKFLDLTAALYANQPAENTNGMSDTDLKKIVTGAGITSSKVSDCISDQTFVPWTSAATARIMDDRTTANGGSGSFVPNSDSVNFGGTPLVLINGEQYNGSITDASAFQQAILAASTTTTSTPTPTPTATN